MLDLGPSWVISIHSLVKRETPRPTIITNFGNHFNPLPRKEGDRWTKKKRAYMQDFNPLPRKEGDDVAADMVRMCPAISIHSLVKRETDESNGKPRNA